MATSPHIDTQQSAAEPLSLYIHWPFCVSKCPYCDFNSHVRASIDEAQWQKWYEREIQWWFESVPLARLETIFFGGGTPSLMSAPLIGNILEAVNRAWGITPQVEISLEANPNSVEALKFHDFRKAGIQRVSLGVQALREDALRFLGRKHSATEAFEALKILQKTFDRYSFDLIYARPGQTLEAWQEELTQALTWVSGHISLYQLTLEEGTPFYARHQRGDWVMPSDEEAAALYEETTRITAAYGLEAYEISNYAKPGHQCRHNRSYWDGISYIGIGPGAHGRLRQGDITWALKNYKVPEAWGRRVDQHQNGLEERLALTDLEVAEERFLMGLRVSSGIHRKTFKRYVGWDPLDLIHPSKLQTLCESGWLSYDAHSLRATPEGRQRLNALLAYMMPLQGLGSKEGV